MRSMRFSRSLRWMMQFVAMAGVSFAATEMVRRRTYYVEKASRLAVPEKGYGAVADSIESQMNAGRSLISTGGCGIETYDGTEKSRKSFIELIEWNRRRSRINGELR